MLALVFVISWLAAGAGPSNGGGPPRWAVAVLPNGHEFALEIAADDASRARGYMGREKIGRRDGMLFIFDRDDRHSFWMKDCKTSLDIIWLDANGRVVWVAPKQPPCPPASECPSILPPVAGRYV